MEVLIFVSASLLADGSALANMPKPSAEIWCSGPILQAVQTAKLFEDSKDFVDCPLLVDPDECWRRWESLEQPVTLGELKKFMVETFGPPGGGLEPWLPPDFRDEPSLLQKLTEPDRSWARELNGLWKVLGRQVTAETLKVRAARYMHTPPCQRRLLLVRASLALLCCNPSSCHTGAREDNAAPFTPRLRRAGRSVPRGLLLG